jgi:tRNA(Ile)-lysidine synthase TilS/MesJ
VRAQYDAKYILTAHHAVDQTETIIGNMIKWAKVRGLSGMLAITGYIFRPLLSFTKQDILTAIHQAGGREFREYEYDGHRSDPYWYFVDTILEGCIRHNMRVEKNNELYRRKIFDVLKEKKGETTWE